MSIKTNFFDGNSVAAADLIAPLAAMLSDGVFGATDFAVSAESPADLAVSVAIGRAVKDGHFIRSDAAEKVPISANTSGYNRIDVVVLQVDDTNRATTLTVVQGIPSSAPVAPTATLSQVVLAQVLVGNNASAIDNNVITDKRVILGPKIEPKQDVYDMSTSLLNGWTPSNGVGPWIIVTGKIGNIVGKIAAPSATITDSNMKILGLPDGITIADTSEGLYVNGTGTHPLQLTNTGLVMYTGTLQANTGGINMTFAIKDEINQRATP